ncbi:MAG: hypothetical protein ACK4YU_13050 [Paracoccus sp. (in: a-proteobacteria)]
MSRSLAACLILLVALTSIGLGTARGTVMQGREVVLCTGHGVVVTRLPDDQGGSRAHLCPDMALSMMTALDAPDVTLTPRHAIALPPPPLVLGLRAGGHDVPVRARDPPGSAGTISAPLRTNQG